LDCSIDQHMMQEKGGSDEFEGNEDELNDLEALNEN
jgi:hypothetical protein